MGLVFADVLHKSDKFNLGRQADGLRCPFNSI